MEKHSNTMIDPKNHSGYITLKRKIYDSQKNFYKVYQYLHTYLWKQSPLHSVYTLTNLYR